MLSSVWLITGCSSGFGAALVQALLARGERVIATSRKPDQLESLRNSGAACMQLDISSSEEELADKAEQALLIYGRVDVLINNAGYAQLGTLEATSAETVYQQFRTNAFGSMNVTRAFLPFFRKRRYGNVVMITSVDGLVGRHGFSPYSASKHALEGFTDCLRKDVESFNIRVLTVQPGTFRTNAITPKSLKVGSSRIKDYNDLYDTLHSFYDYHGSEPGDPAKLANRVIQLVTLEGPFESARTLTHLPLGQDAWEEIREKCEETLKSLEIWKDVICSTDYDEES